MGFAENLKKLPGISHISAIRLLDGEGAEVGLVENKPGSVGSVSIYNYLAQTYGAITADAAKKGLELYAEHVEEARAYPGRHPNIDRLLMLESGGAVLRVKHVFAV